MLYIVLIYTDKCGVLFICSRVCQSLSSDKLITPHFLFIPHNPPYRSWMVQLVAIMTYVADTEFVIREIIGVCSNSIRKAVIEKRCDSSIRFHASMAHGPLCNDKDEVILYPCDQEFKNYTSNPFVCYSPNGKQLEKLLQEDILCQKF